MPARKSITRTSYKTMYGTPERERERDTGKDPYP
jgi:hypothetical protein